MTEREIRQPYAASNDISCDVILVDEQDHPVGTTGKLAAHERGGTLHRAFSVFIFNSQGQMLLQQRAATKYHFGTLWTNACCSHPRPGEEVADAARRRLQEEFGFDLPLRRAFAFVYRAEDLATGLAEHEYDHVFVGRFDGTPLPNPDEIGDWKWIDSAELLRDVDACPQKYTPWFKIALDRVIAHLRDVKLPPSP
jgi:isopentenyl-diphosphate delta-isomerase